MILNITIGFLMIVLCLVAYQDIKSRTMHIILPVLIFITAMVVNYLSVELDVSGLLWNIGFIILNIFGLVAYYSFKSRKIVNPIDAFIGFGDILFLLAITPLFNFKAFILFFIGGLICSLLAHSLLNIFKKVPTIPLAGYLSLFLIIVLCIDIVFKVNIPNQWL